jgi:uncharacterized protein (TIGR03083 family)
MSDLAHHTITALRQGHDALAARVRASSLEDLHRQSGASAWDVHGVLSHLGSGAEIQLGTIRSQLDESGRTPAPDNTAVWDRWNEMSPDDRAAGFVATNAELVAAYEGLSDAQLESVRFDLGFLPTPITVAELAGMRLNEQTLHGWDVVVAFEPDATLAAEAVPILVDRSDVFLEYIGKASEIEDRPIAIAVRTSDPERSFGLLIEDTVSLAETARDPRATLELPAEAWLRLIAGRLGVERTPPGVSASGAVSLEDLRRVFPGY